MHCLILDAKLASPVVKGQPKNNSLAFSIPLLALLSKMPFRFLQRTSQYSEEPSIDPGFEPEEIKQASDMPHGWTSGLLAAMPSGRASMHVWAGTYARELATHGCSAVVGCFRAWPPFNILVWFMSRHYPHHRPMERPHFSGEPRNIKQYNCQ